MTGIGGIIYGLVQIGHLLHDATYIAYAKRLMSSIETKHVEEDCLFDIIFGSAGLLLALLSLYKACPEDQVLELARCCGKHLRKQAKDVGKGAVSWGDSPCLGFSHGNAGIAYALGSLLPFDSSEDLLGTIKKALAFERRHYSPENKNWPRLPNDFACGWCHGATGIGMGRLLLSSLLQDPEVDREIQLAYETTRANMFTGRCNLCCGLLGRMEFIREINREPLEPFYQSILLQLKTKTASHRSRFHAGDGGDRLFSPSHGGQSALLATSFTLYEWRGPKSKFVTECGIPLPPGDLQSPWWLEAKSTMETM